MFKPVWGYMASVVFAVVSVEACSLTSLDYLKVGDDHDSGGAGETASNGSGSGGSGDSNSDTGESAAADRAKDGTNAADDGNDAATGTGGFAGMGGVVAIDGAVATGGVVSTGGVAATGGVVATGGISATGGVSGAGGCSACTHSITLTGESTTALFGQPGAGTSHKDRCPVDQVIIGYSGTLRNDIYVTQGVPVLQVSSVQPVCGSLHVSQTGLVTRSSRGTLVQRGDAGAAGSWSKACPTNQVVVGIYGHSGTIVDQLGFICATLNGKVSGCSISLEIGQITNLDSVGGTGGYAFKEQCPAGMVSSGQNLYSEKWVDSFGLLCSTPVPVGECGT
jgi:hypothetical protein